MARRLGLDLYSGLSWEAMMMGLVSGAEVAKAAPRRRTPKYWSVDLTARGHGTKEIQRGEWLVIDEGFDPVGWREVDGPEIRRRAVEGEGDNEASRVVAGSLVAGVGGVETWVHRSAAGRRARR